MNDSICNRVGSTEWVKAQAQIWSHTFSFINSASLKCAIQMGIPDIIHNHSKPMTLAALMTAMSVHPKKSQYLYNLMLILTNSGFFAMRGVCEENGEEGYVLTPSAHCLLSDHPLSQTPFVSAMLDGAFIKPWNYLSTWFQNDDSSPFETAYGRSIWEQAGLDPQLNSIFNDAMASDTRLVASMILEKCGFVLEGLNSLVDVGGGTGTMARAIAKSFPNLSCINFDLQHAVAGLEGSDNLTHVQGDMFESIPQADAVLLKWILHDWGDEECIQILVNCKKAIQKSDDGKGGKVIIIDKVTGSIEKGASMNEPELQLFFDMALMTLTSGRERGEMEWADIFQKSGFKAYKITTLAPCPRSVIEVFP